MNDHVPWNDQTLTGEWLQVRAGPASEEPMWVRGVGGPTYGIPLADADHFLAAHPGGRYFGEQAAADWARLVHAAELSNRGPTSRAAWEVVGQGRVLDLGLARQLLGFAGHPAAEQTGGP